MKPADAFHSDAPITTPDQDGLGYSSFAEVLASSIDRLPREDSFVVGIKGPWGSGKTSFANLLRHYFDQSPHDKRIVTEYFTPWLSNGSDDLLLSFLGKLAAGVGAVRNDSKSRDALVDFLIPFVTSSVNARGGAPVKSFGDLSRRLVKQGQTLEQRQEALGKSLRAAKKRLVMFVDDLDRLSLAEISSLLRFLRAACTLPNIIYVLTYDEERLLDAIAPQFAAPGAPPERGRQLAREYLKKFIQIPMDLPIPPRFAVRKMLQSRFEAICGRGFSLATPADVERWHTAFGDFIAPRLVTPRDANLLANRIATSYPMLSEEVDFVDLVTLEAAYVFHPGLHAWIKTHLQLLAGDEQVLQAIPARDREQLLASWQQHVPLEDRRACKVALELLFPASFRAGGADAPPESNHRRVCFRRPLGAYFRFGHYEFGVPISRLRHLVADSRSSAKLEKTLLEFMKEGSSPGEDAREIMESLVDVLEEDGVPAAPAELVKAVIAVGDSFIRRSRESEDRMGLPLERILLRAVKSLLPHIGDHGRQAAVLREAIASSKSLYTLTAILAGLREEAGQFAALEQILLERIAEAADEEDFFDRFESAAVLRHWATAPGGRAEVEEWIGSLAKSRTSLVRILSNFVSSGDDNGAPSEFDVETFRSFAKPSILSQPVKQFLEKRGLKKEEERILQAAKTAIG